MSQPELPPPPAPDWGRAYTVPDLTVYYDKARCIHCAACIHGLPQVFNTAARPWIQADAAPAEQVAEVVRRCPTGALHYVLKIGRAEPPEPTSLEVRANGPLFVRGDLMIVAAQGTVRETRALRCDASHNKPYCDGSHRQIGFEAADGETLNLG